MWAVDIDAFCVICRMANLKSPEIARETGYSPAYARVLKTGKRTRASRTFLERFADLVAKRMERQSLAVLVLLRKDSDESRV